MTSQMADHACLCIHTEERCNASRARPGPNTTHTARRALYRRPRRFAPTPISAHLTNRPTNYGSSTLEPKFELTFTPRGGALEDVDVEIYLCWSDEHWRDGRR